MDEEKGRIKNKKKKYMSVCKRFEKEYNMSSDEFMDKLESGKLEDRDNYFDWFANGTISVKKLIVVKESDGKVKERRVVLYDYVKDNPLSSDTVAIVRVSALAPTAGSYEDALNICKDFMGDTIPCMFEFQQGENIIAVQLANSGFRGWLIIGALVSVPIGIIVYPRIKKRRDKVF